MRHSPEPWTEAPGDHLQAQVEIVDRNDTPVATVPLQGGKLLLSEALENVKLIKAAPLLLKAAIMALNWMEGEAEIEEMCEHDRDIYDRTMEALRISIKEARS